MKGSFLSLLGLFLVLSLGAETQGRTQETLRHLLRRDFVAPPSLTSSGEIALIYWEAGDYKGGLRYLERALSRFTGESSRDRMGLLTVPFLEKTGARDRALFLAGQLAFFSPHEGVRQGANALTAYLFLLNGQREHFTEMVQRGRISWEGEPLKDPERARSWALIPGAGFLYAGNPEKALVSMALNGGSVGLFVLSLMTGRYSQALILDINLVYRFYSGGRYQSAREVTIANKRAWQKGFVWDLEGLSPVEEELLKSFLLNY